jgi:hypothetical protein
MKFLISYGAEGSLKFLGEVFLGGLLLWGVSQAYLLTFIQKRKKLLKIKRLFVVESVGLALLFSWGIRRGMGDSLKESGRIMGEGIQYGGKAVGAILSLIDVRIKRLPLSFLGIFTALSLLNGEVRGGGLETGISVGIGGGMGAFFYYKSSMPGFLKGKKRIIGGGDVILMALCGTFLSPVQWPLFCLEAGILGLISGVYCQVFYKTSSFPLAPALLGSLIIIGFK